MTDELMHPDDEERNPKEVRAGFYRVRDALKANDRDAMLAIIEEASEKLSSLCHGERWTMRVPVEDTDTDVVLGRAIDLARDEPSPTKQARLRRVADRLQSAKCETARPMTSPISSDWTPEDEQVLREWSVLRDRAFAGRLARYAFWQRGQINELRAELLRVQKRCDEGYTAHAHSFGALQRISMIVGTGEVDEYDDIVKMVEALASSCSISPTPSPIISPVASPPFSHRND